VLHWSTASAPAISLDRIANAFSGDASAVAGGGLYSIAGSGFSSAAIDLGLNASQDLPTELGGNQVKFDGVPAAILQTGPGRVIVAPPSKLPAGQPNGRIPGFTAVQLFSGGASSNIVWMPVSKSLPGLLTRDFPNPAPHPDFAEGDVRNADGTKNDADHPAAAGSTITLFVTGMGATIPRVAPGSIAHSQAVVAAGLRWATESSAFVWVCNLRSPSPAEFQWLPIWSVCTSSNGISAAEQSGVEDKAGDWFLGASKPAG
jgi:uncharacterized protein (TIGR03437 family)